MRVRHCDMPAEHGPDPRDVIGAACAVPGVVGTPTVTVRATANRAEHGSTVLDAAQAGYIAHLHNLTSNTLARCVVTLSPRAMRCAW